MIKIYKYGGNILKDNGNRKDIYKYIKSEIVKGNKMFMVVSAFGREKDSFSTDSLSKNIELLSGIEKDRIITFGEIYSSLIIKNEMLKENIKVASVNYDEIGIMCDSNYQDGNIINVDMSYLSELINKYDVVIVPGFIAESIEGKIISLGRNTSDLTALLIANYFNIDTVNIVKDVKGVYKQDPKLCKNKQLIENISYDEMISIIYAGSTMFALKTLMYAKDKKIKINITGVDMERGTLISEESSHHRVLFINKEKEEIKIVIKDMDVFNEIFNMMVKNKVKFEELVIIKDIVYVKGEKEKIIKCLQKFKQ